MKFARMIFFKAVIMLSGILCSTVFMMAIHSANTMCVGCAYQPKTPKEIDKYRRK